MDNQQLLAIGLRVHLKHQVSLGEFYVDNFHAWLKYRGYEIVDCTSGFHLNTEAPHIHIHVVAKGKLLSNPIASLKRDYNMNKILTRLPKYRDYEENNFTGQTYKNKINMSLQMKTLEEKDLKRYLQYPLKEQNCLTSSLTAEETEQLMELAHTEYLASKRRRETEQKHEEKKLSEWQELVKIVDEFQPGDIEEAFRKIIEHYKKWEKPPTMKFIWDQTQRYCIKKNLITTDQIVNHFLWKTPLR